MTTDPSQLPSPQTDTAAPLPPRRRSKQQRPRRWQRVLVGAVVTLAVLIVAAGGGVYAVLRRSLPQTHGELKLAGLQAPVSVYRDERGVPHIVASNEHDLYMAQGYVTAQDRLFQMDLFRRLVSGRLSEAFGAAMIENDKYLRTLMLHRSAEQSLLAHPPEVIAALEAYAAGVNAYIEQAAARKRLPPEFVLLGYTPEPWEPVHTVGIAKMMAMDLGGNWETEVWRVLAGAKVGGERIAELWPQYPADAPVIVATGEAPGPDAGADLAAAPERGLGGMLADVLAEPGLLAAASALQPYVTGGSRADIGSNNWVVSGARTQTGKPLLANDPHLGIQMPAIWYQTHLSIPAEDFDVIGVTFAGAPGIVIGHNRHIAWGVTNVGPDVQDLYIERPHPDDPYQFEYMGKYEQATVYREEIRVKGQDEPVIHEVIVTRHGPIISDVAGSEDNRPESRLALRWTAHDPSADLAAFLYINRATNWQEFRDALRHFTVPAQNFVFAGADGTIGYRAQGHVPIRRNGDGMLPVPGWTDEYEWEGFIPFDSLPESVNPPAGYIATANNKVVGDDYPYFLGNDWASPYRAARIVEVLDAASGVTAADMITLQTDVANLQARLLLPVLLPAAEAGLAAGAGLPAGTDGIPAAETVQAALQQLQQWDQQDRADSTGAALWHAWYAAIVQELFLEDLGEDLFRQMPLQRQVTDQLILDAADGRVSSWFGERGLEGVAVTALQRAVAALGDGWANVKWGDLHQVRFDHPLGQVAILQKLFSTKPYPVGGSGVAVLATGNNMRQIGAFPVTSGPVWRQVVDLADPAGNAWDLNGAGQSGHPLSPHHHDQAEAWTAGEYARKWMDSSAFAGMRELRLVP